MNRRGFLGTLLAGLGAMVIKPSDGLLWIPQPEAIEIVSPEAIITLKQLTTEILRRVVAAHPTPVPFIDGNKLGCSADGIVLNHQWNVAARMPPEVDQFGLDLTHIEPISQLLIDRLGSSELKGCGLMGSPRGANVYTAFDNRTHLSVRGVQMYDISEDALRLRFDMLVAQ